MQIFVCSLTTTAFSSFRQTTIPYEDVVAVRTTRSPQLLQKAAKLEKRQQQQRAGGWRFWRRRVTRVEEDAVNVNKFGFLGATSSSLGDTLDIYYVPDASHTNKFTLEKVPVPVTRTDRSVPVLNFC